MKIRFISTAITYLRTPKIDIFLINVIFFSSTSLLCMKHGSRYIVNPPNTTDISIWVLPRRLACPPSTVSIYLFKTIVKKLNIYHSASKIACLINTFEMSCFWILSTRCVGLTSVVLCSWWMCLTPVGNIANMLKIFALLIKRLLSFLQRFFCRNN